MAERTQATEPDEAGRIREAIWVAVHGYTADGAAATEATVAVMDALAACGIDLRQEVRAGDPACSRWERADG